MNHSSIPAGIAAPLVPEDLKVCGWCSLQLFAQTPLPHEHDGSSLELGPGQCFFRRQFQTPTPRTAKFSKFGFSLPVFQKKEKGPQNPNFVKSALSGNAHKIDLVNSFGGGA